MRPSLEALADGREQPASVDGEERVTGYVYDIVPENAQILSETADGRITDYVYGNTRLAAYSGDGQEVLRYICDARGSVIRTTDGRVTRSCRYLPYGEQITGSGDEKKSGYAFNGEYYDAASNMQYLRARWYEPAMMRFGQQDPLAGDMYQPLTVNRYAYVINNPVMYADPSGEAGGRYRTGNYRTIQYGEGTYQNSSSRNTGHWTSDYRTYHYDRSVTHYRTGDYRTVNYADTYNSSTYRSGSYRTVNLAPVKKYIKVTNSSALRAALKKIGKGKSYDQLIIRIQGASVRVRNKTEAWAVVDALKAFENMPNTDSWSVIKKNTMLNQACRKYAGIRTKNDVETARKKPVEFETTKIAANERRILNSFAKGKAVPTTYEGGTTLYRVSGRLSGYWSLDPPPLTEYQWRVDYAIKQEFCNDETVLYKITIPEGSSLGALEGRVGSQGMGLYGGAHQAYIDFEEVPRDWIEIGPTKWK